MHLSTLLPLLPLAAASRSAKRGLPFVSNKDHPSDNAVWVQKGSSLTWYYNYHDVPSTAFAGISQEKVEFVPMMWGVDASNPEDSGFLGKVKAMISDSVNITHALSFNEPDVDSDDGGAEVEPGVAAKAWVANFEKLAEQGVEVGLPACSGRPGSLQWLLDFVEECAELVSEGEDEKKNCTWDFLPVHWYGDFDGLASHIGDRLEAFPGTPIWVTEYAFPDQDLRTTQHFYNTSIDWFDDSDFVSRYAYYGAFRSDDSKIGPNAAFLNRDGELTDVGSWYLGGNATGVDPLSGEGGAGSLGAPVGAAVMLFAGVMVLGLV